MLRHIFTFSILLIVSVISYAESSRDMRLAHSFGIDVAMSTLSLPVPGARGVAINYNLSPNWQVSLDYMTTTFELNFSNIDLAGFNEKRYGIKFKRFYGNSFNLGFGYVRRINNVYLDPVIYDFSIPELKSRTKAHSNMLHFSMANQWQFDSWMFGVDWLVLDLATSGRVDQSSEKQVDNESNKRSIRSAENVLTWYPNMAVFNIRLGYMF
jgi:hypothetical protein